MIRKIFIENSNDERTNTLKLILDLEKIPYYFLNNAVDRDFKESLFLFTTTFNSKANFYVILNPEMLERPLQINQAEQLKLKVNIEKISELLKEFNLPEEIEIPRIPVFKLLEYKGIPIAKIHINNSEYPAVLKQENSVIFLFDILTLFINLISENYFEKIAEKNILSNTIIEKIYKKIPYNLRIPIYRRYYKKVHQDLEKTQDFKTNFPIDIVGYTLLELVRISILQFTNIIKIGRWPVNYNYSVLITHDTEPTKYAYKKGLKLLLNKLAENNYKSTITLVSNYVKYIPKEDKERIKLHEIGCHDLYHDRKFLLISTGERKERLRTAKDILEKTFNREINFFRAPTLQRPSDLFDSLEETNYKYDSSIIDSQREQPYCGKGNSFFLPFYPIINNKKSEILELTISAPDCISPYFFGYTMQETLELFENKIKFIEKINGLAVFIVHTPAWGKKDAKNRFMLLDNILENSKNSWLTNIKELTEWWENRSNLYLELQNNKMILINKNSKEIHNISVKIETSDKIAEIKVPKIKAQEKLIIA